MISTCEYFTISKSKLETELPSDNWLKGEKINCCHEHMGRFQTLFRKSVKFRNFDKMINIISVKISQIGDHLSKRKF